VRLRTSTILITFKNKTMVDTSAPASTLDSSFNLEHALNVLSVQTEQQIYEQKYDELYTKISMAFAMCTHSRLGSESKWLAELSGDLCRKICAAASEMVCELACACASPCPISAIENRIEEWQLLFPVNQKRVLTWARIIELQRVLNRCWEEGCVTFTVPSQEELNNHKVTWWMVMS
jgi:hypothetical protein